MNVPEQLKSRKLWLALVAAGVAFANGFFDMGLTTEQVITVMTPLLTYIGVEGLADIKGRGSGSV